MMSDLPVNGIAGLTDPGYAAIPTYENDGLIFLRSRVDSLCRELRENGRFRTSEAYRSAFEKWCGYLNMEDATMASINEISIADYEIYLRTAGLAPHTIAFYLRNLRAIFNKIKTDAITGGVVDAPFKSVNRYVPKVDATVLSPDEMNRLKELARHIIFLVFVCGKDPKDELFATPDGTLVKANLIEALLIFLFSYYANGLSFRLLLGIRRNQLYGRYLTLEHKNGKVTKIVVKDELKHIITFFVGKYPGRRYIIPVLSGGADESEYLKYQGALRIQNYRLKELGRILGIETPLSTSVVCRTFRAQNRPIPREGN